MSATETTSGYSAVKYSASCRAILAAASTVIRVRHRPPGEEPATTASTKSSIKLAGPARSVKSKFHDPPSSSVKVTIRKDSSRGAGRE
jgi:hypothetical protein